MTLATSLRKTASKLMGDAGYIAPVIRQEWNAGAAAWGFASREQIKQVLAS